MKSRSVTSLPAAVDDAAWSEVPSVSLRMTPLWWRNQTADPDLQVQAVHDGKTIAVRIVVAETSAAIARRVSSRVV